ncbi:hypothetical protein QYE76_020627 [Lolium multiflorum]|uniref:Uncharacterized protein n=1 Tax=Lolium multiflorum TaxID=4521 RepID=A0AAD8VS26_LOLMU|nr:hypothetical protein QYE76_020627 [Lolium multiflorum]
MAVIHPKRLAQLVSKWQRVKTPSIDDQACCTTSRVADKGHCAMYTVDGRRFEVPLVYLATTIFGELLRMSQEEFGFTCDSGIILPFDAAVMKYVMCFLRSREGNLELCSDALPIFKLYGDTCSAAPAACSLYLLNILNICRV